jgi:hypothetical protein
MNNPRKTLRHSYYPLLSSSLIWNLVESVNIINLCLLKPVGCFMYIFRQLFTTSVSSSELSGWCRGKGMGEETILDWTARLSCYFYHHSNHDIFHL